MRTFILILLLFVFILFSCAEKASENNGNETTRIPDEDISSSDTEEKRLYPDLPEIRFDGYEMKFLVRNETHMIFVAKDIYAEEENGDLINDAVYRRNRVIEDKYDIYISQEPVSNPGTYIQKYILADDCPFDVMSEATVMSATLSANKMIVDLNTVPYLDFKKPWWDQSLTKELSIGGKLFCNVSELIISDKDGTWGVLFNKNIITNYKLDDPYELVTNHKWTIDKFYEMSQNVSVDLNGDGKYYVLDDMFGFATENYNIFMFIIGAECRLAVKDSNDLPVLSTINDRFLTAYEKAVAIDKDISTVNAGRITGAVASDPFYGGIIPAFNDGRILFYMGSMALVPMFRGMEQDFGILPIPKFDEAQDTYYTTMSVFNNGAIYIPTTNVNLERTGIILEALSAESLYTLRPAYYDMTLKDKFSRDNESSTMLDILFANRIIDIGSSYNFGGILELVRSGRDNFMSGYEALVSKANLEIEKVIEQLKYSNIS